MDELAFNVIVSLRFEALVLKYVPTESESVCWIVIGIEGVWFIITGEGDCCCDCCCVFCKFRVGRRPTVTLPSFFFASAMVHSPFFTCVLICLILSSDLANPLLHNGQIYGFSFVWHRVCVLKWSFRVKALGQ